MPFYRYWQNNSFGDWDGPIRVLYVEAASPEIADQRAIEKAGVYFDGCASGKDCACCGDRWRRAWEDDSGDDAWLDASIRDDRDCCVSGLYTLYLGDSEPRKED